ncbi:MAG: MFS transporter [Nitrososphaerota archaeon]|jgi:EmrB/QacA subfamily drug resistance transporter|nr:MFS transporter [Nitrososphaerota archaeon]MDG6927874.1 MFS transporter [Nitrososphaerota archaeon]MDG6931019.1 MFS transporter [Nitrososphaerota archaeon]MDG6932121.1 MFS transporter [Nitrososphaerota archaeon]MDG6936676.1 MFS transporter [Nitrososphaerota archaeon]
MEYKWTVWSVVVIGSLMSAIDSTIVILAILPIAEDLRTDYITIIWVIVAYILVNTSLMLSLGRIADIYGRKRLYNVGFVVFIIGSALSGLSTSGLMLVGFRAVQGIGAALLTSNSFALISEVFPANERGKAFGLNSIVWGTGSVLGIILGGVIITYTTWRMIFFINVPIGIAGTYLAYRYIQSRQGRAANESFDILAAISFTAGLLFALLGATWGLLYSWKDPTTYLFFGLSPAFFLLFIVYESKFSKDPIVDFSMFRNRIFSFSVTVGLLQSLALFSVNYLLMFFFEGIVGLPIITAAYLILPMALMSAAVGPFAGRLSDRVGARVVGTAGLAIQAFALLLLTQLTVSTSIYQVAFIEAIYGVGGGMFWPANTSAIMSSSSRERYGIASGIMNTFRNTGMVLSFVVALVAATSVIPAYLVYQMFVGTLYGKLSLELSGAYLGGQRFAFIISIALLVVAAVMSSARGTRAAVQAKKPQ